MPVFRRRERVGRVRHPVWSVSRCRRVQGERMPRTPWRVVRKVWRVTWPDEGKVWRISGTDSLMLRDLQSPRRLRDTLERPLLSQALPSRHASRGRRDHVIVALAQSVGSFIIHSRRFTVQVKRAWQTCWKVLGNSSIGSCCCCCFAQAGTHIYACPRVFYFIFCSTHAIFKYSIGTHSQRVFKTVMTSLLWHIVGWFES